MKIAFSTVGCPELSLEQVARSASDWGYQGVELRVSPDGVGATAVGSDPMRADAETMHDLFEDAGVDLVSLATGVRFDKSVWPPVVGRLFQSEEIGVGETKAAVEKAAESGAFYVRVFGHQLPGGEPRAWGVRRVSDRLALAAQTARNTSVRVLIENSGSFARASELAEVHGLVNSPFLAMAYNIVPAWMAGEDPVEACGALMDNLAVVKVGDVGEDGRPALLGAGRLPVERFVRTLRDRGYRGWIVYEYPKLWRPEVGETGGVLREAAERLYGWAGAPVGV
jgi:sugar phosphate isomerase/epimerase|tara:strand:- start:3563 stop:4408 length:846 start_codon:yes stop_codon:yes gene_type:complete